MYLKSLGYFCYNYLKVHDVVSGINLFCVRTTLFLPSFLLLFSFFIPKFSNKAYASAHFIRNSNERLLF